MKTKYGISIFMIIAISVMAAAINAAVLIYDKNETRQVVKQGEKAYIAIIIDDFGSGGEGTKEMLKLRAPFTGAVMPMGATAKADAAALISAGKGVIIHLPMEAKHGKKSWLGDYAVMTDMEDEELKGTIKRLLDEGDYAIGVNNHMGSKATEDERVMDILFKELKERGMFFADSMTTPNSLSEKYGKKYGVRVIKRDVFLDSVDSKEKIVENLRKTKEVALKKGYAVCIGHVGAEGGRITAEAIGEVSNEFEKNGIEFVTVERLLDVKEKNCN